MRKEEKQFNEVLLSWLEEIKMMRAPSTYVKYYRMSCKYIIPYFQGEFVQDVTIGRLKEYREILFQMEAEGLLSEGSIRCMIMIVNAVMNDAYQRRLIGQEVHILPGLKKQKNVVQVYSEEEQQTLEAYMKRHINITTVGIYLCLYTGLRLGEICALKWENMNTEEGFIHVKYTTQRLSRTSRAWETAGVKGNLNGFVPNLPRASDTGLGPHSNLIITAPKSNSSNRLVPVPSFLLPYIREYEKKSKPEQFFLSGDAQLPMEPRTFQYQYRRYTMAAGVRYLNFHSLRHTFATRCITIGMDPKTLSEILGHSDIKITMDYYFHSTMEYKKYHIERLKAALQKRNREKAEQRGQEEERLRQEEGREQEPQE